MTYTGTIDLGDGEPRTQLAGHGLVFMFVPFCESYAQPVAVFASKGPTKGTEVQASLCGPITKH